MSQTNVTLDTQAKIDAFTHTSITGNLIIRGTVVNSIRSLAGLRNLTSVGGNLEIWNNFALRSLSGLENITRLGYRLYIGTSGSDSNFGNPRLTNLCGVRQLITNNQVRSGEYFVSNNDYNPSYAQIQETESCSSTYIGSLTLTSQTEIDAFRSTSITRYLTIKGRTITSLAGLRSLRFVGEFDYSA